MEIELPSGEIAEFPDDMPHDQIESALQQHFAPKKTTQADKDQAFEMIKQQHPRMPELLIKALMPLAVSESEKKMNPSNERGTATGAFFAFGYSNTFRGGEQFSVFDWITG